MVTFDHDVLRSHLEHLSPLWRPAFALSCAERLLPLYKLYIQRGGKGDHYYLHSTLKQLWRGVLRGQIEGMQSFLDKYESLIPKETAIWTPLNPLAENAIAAVAFACRCQLTGGAEHAVWAAVQNYEALDYIAQQLQSIDYMSADAERALLNTEHVQAELGRQLRDLAELTNAAVDRISIGKIMRHMRRRAKSDGNNLVPIASAICSTRS